VIFIYTPNASKFLKLLGTNINFLHAVPQDQFLFENKPRKIRLKNKKLLDDYFFTSICFWEHRLPLENKLHFLNFPKNKTLLAYFSASNIFGAYFHDKNRS
jgi:hypothetical protein